MKVLFTIPVLLLFIMGCSPREESPLPNAILNLEKVETLSGNEAANVIDHLHQNEVTPAQNYVGRYADEQYTATYYLSLYDSSDEAQEELRAMVESMERGGHVFDHVRKINIKDKDVWMALGMGQAHYFYAEGNQLIWLAIDVPLAEEAIESLL